MLKVVEMSNWPKFDKVRHEFWEVLGMAQKKQGAAYCYGHPV